MPTLSDSSVHEDEHDIIAEYENRDSDGSRDLNKSEESGDENDGNAENNEESKEVTARRIDPSTSKKHIVRNPIPTLNTERLKGPKGVHTIEKYFEGFKFYGKGHEKADLDRVMKRLEHWAHRLFPKLDFDDFLEKTEKLGTKKDLQVFIRKYKQDMLPDEDFGVPGENDDDDEEDKEEDNAPVDEFDMLIAEQIEKQKQVASQHGTSINTSASGQDKEEVFNQLLAQTMNKIEPIKETVPPLQFSDEVKERIERNRQQAIQRRLARLQALQEEAKKKKLESTMDIEISNENESSETQNI